MSKITNDGLTQSGIGCFIAVLPIIMAIVGAKGFTDRRISTFLSNQTGTVIAVYMTRMSGNLRSTETEAVVSK